MAEQSAKLSCHTDKKKTATWAVSLFVGFNLLFLANVFV